MRILYVDNAGQLQILTEMPPGWNKANLQSTELLWIDLNHVESNDITEQFLAQHFGFHPWPLMMPSTKRTCPRLMIGKPISTLPCKTSPVKPTCKPLVCPSWTCFWANNTSSLTTCRK